MRAFITGEILDDRALMVKTAERRARSPAQCAGFDKAEEDSIIVSVTEDKSAVMRRRRVP
jgi:hypothetical protein